MSSEDGFSREEQVHNPAFFQLYIPHHCSLKLRIPPPFIKRFKDCIPENISLKNSSGRVWPAKLTYIDKKLHITHGWQRYVKDHKMQCGEFLVFRYQQDSSFLVTAYGHGAMSKHEPREEKSRVSDGGRYPDVHASEVERIVFFRTFQTKFQNAVRVPKHVVEACSITLPQAIYLTNDKGEGVTTKLRAGTDRVIMGYARLAGFWRVNNVREGDKLEFEVIRGHGRKIEKVVMRNKTQSNAFRRGY